jgi:Concanavalin A-like lectin/glucanases superfamily
MYKLILHHVYRSSAPFLDVSGHGNHAQGANVGWSADGATPQSGAAVFNGSTSRGLVPVSPLWQDLYALRVEALVRFDPVQGTPGHPVRVRRHLVVEGPLSFSVFIGQERTVTGMVMGLVKDPDADDDPSASDTLTATLSGGGSVDPFTTFVADLPDTLPIPPGYKLDWVPVTSTPEFAPDGQERTIEPGQWTRIRFTHMGTSLLLHLDGVLAGMRHDIISPVLPVQGTGVHIGCAPGAYPDTLRGRLDELRIWKYDPHYHTKKFFCRPMRPETEACLRLLLGRLEQLATEEPTRAQMLGVLDCLNAAIAKLQRAVLQRGQPALDQLARFGRRYDDLWCRGAIDSHAMRALSDEFISWLAQAAGDAWSEYLLESSACIQRLKGLDLGPEICCAADCDPAFAAFLNDINRHLAADLLSCLPERNGKRPHKRPHTKPGRQPDRPRPYHDELPKRDIYGQDEEGA